MPSNQIPVSVVMAVHNGANVVRTAIESMRSQTFSDWEMIVVDDGSRDDTFSIIQEFAAVDERIVLVRNSNNEGLAKSLNEAFRIARGDLIARMDADDVNFPDRIAQQVEFMQGHREISVLGTAVELVDQNGTQLRTAYRPERHEALVRRIYKENPFIHPTVMMRRTFLEATRGYDERLQRAQDYDLWLRGYREFRFHNLQQVLMRHRVRRQLPLKTILWGTLVLVRGAYRDRTLLSNGLYALRFLTAAMLNNLGLRDTRLR